LELPETIGGFIGQIAIAYWMSHGVRYRIWFNNFKLFQGNWGSFYFKVVILSGDQTIGRLDEINRIIFSIEYGTLFTKGQSMGTGYYPRVRQFLRFTKFLTIVLSYG